MFAKEQSEQDNKYRRHEWSVCMIRTISAPVQSQTATPGTDSRSRNYMTRYSRKPRRVDEPKFCDWKADENYHINATKNLARQVGECGYRNHMNRP